MSTPSATQAVNPQNLTQEGLEGYSKLKLIQMLLQQKPTFMTDEYAKEFTEEKVLECCICEILIIRDSDAHDNVHINRDDKIICEDCIDENCDCESCDPCDCGCMEEQKDEVELSNVKCKQCDGVLPPHTIEDHLDMDHPIHNCPTHKEEEEEEEDKQCRDCEIEAKKHCEECGGYGSGGEEEEDSDGEEEERECFKCGVQYMGKESECCCGECCSYCNPDWKEMEMALNKDEYTVSAVGIYIPTEDSPFKSYYPPKIWEKWVRDTDPLEFVFYARKEEESSELPGYMSCMTWSITDEENEKIKTNTYNTSSAWALECLNIQFDEEDDDEEEDDEAKLDCEKCNPNDGKPCYVCYCGTKEEKDYKNWIECGDCGGMKNYNGLMWIHCKCEEKE